ncbi:hypothetical protein ACWFMI_24555 [Nocardiopsis terrae]|uniref:hypothetical protein n=1 Tax=Streptomyces sp. NPDC057554 TaxID=3350538 RepID=UPI00367E088B
MAEHSGVFADSDLDTAEDLARWYRQFAPSGVVTTGVDAGQQMEVTANGTGLITIGTGYAIVGGYWHRISVPITRGIQANTSGQPRQDLVVVRADPQADEATVMILPGSPGASAPPSPERNPLGVWDMVLASITVAGGSTVVAPGDVDLRPCEFTAPGGAVPCLSTHRPPSPFEGMLISETDTGRVRVRVGETWRTVSDTEYPKDWQVIDLRAGFEYAGSGARPQWRWVRPGTVELRGTIARSNGAGISSNLYVGRLPSEARPNANRRYLGASAAHGTGAWVRMEVRSTYQGVHSTNAGRIWVYTDGTHSPAWVSLDGWFYDVT